MLITVTAEREIYQSATVEVVVTLSQIKNKKAMSTMVTNFVKWSDKMQFYRVPTIAAMILIQGCILVPLVLFTMPSSAANVEVPIMTIATFGIITLNLADMPTKITIPVFSATTFIALVMFLYNIVF